MSVERAHEFGNEEEFVVETGEREREVFGTGNELGKEDESCSVKNDGETISNERMKEMRVDRLSELPESLILHILNFLSFDAKQVAITSVLSKRWQFLWSELPELNFCDDKWDVEKTPDFVSWVHRTIIFRGESYIEQFLVDFLYDGCFAEHVDVWVLFAVIKKVEKLYVLLHSDTCFYTLPQVLYSNPSLTCMCLQRCIVAPDSVIEWQCLTHLAVQDAQLPEDVFRKILSGCPVLHSLVLNLCWEFKRLDVNSESLHDLTVYDSEDNIAPLLEISAPYLRSLDVSFSPTEKKLQLINVQSLVSAEIDFTVYDDSVQVMNHTMELLEKTLHAKELTLGGPCVEALSELIVNGWRLPQSRRKNLVVSDTSRADKSITSILGLLESSPNLETLRIECFDSYEKSATTWVPAARNDLDCDLSNLKIVHLLNYADPNLGGEPMLTIARTLLKRATKLEVMKIKAQGNLTEFPSDFAKMSKKVLSYPRSSKKAVVVLCR